MLEFKPDFEKVMERFEAWWDCQILDRPLTSLAFAKPESDRVPYPEKSHATPRDRWMDTEYLVDCTDASVRNTVYYADSYPRAWPNLGPEVFSAFYGCEMVYTDDTAWSKPILKDLSPESVAKLRLDRRNFYFKKIIEMTDALLERGKGRFVVGYTDLHCGGDALAAFRDPQELLMDVLQDAGAVKALNDRITDDFLEVFDLYHDKLSAAGMPSTTWCSVTCKGKCHVPANDFSCMISNQAFEDLFIPGIIRECQHMDRCLYHLDGPNALRFLDRLLEIPEIHAIQWVPGAGHEYWADSIEVYQRIQRKGKALQLGSIPVKDLPRLFEVLRPEGVWICHVSGISNKDEADAALQAIARWK
jgi:hypothetical protein